MFAAATIAIAIPTRLIMLRDNFLPVCPPSLFFSASRRPRAHRAPPIVSMAKPATTTSAGTRSRATVAVFLAVGAVLGQLRHTLADIRRYPQSMMFLIAYLLYNDAIQAVLALASQFGNDELKIPVSSLTMSSTFFPPALSP